MILFSKILKYKITFHEVTAYLSLIPAYSSLLNSARFEKHRQQKRSFVDFIHHGPTTNILIIPLEYLKKTIKFQCSGLPTHTRQ